MQNNTVSLYDILASIRETLKTNNSDTSIDGLFSLFCSSNFMQSNSQLFQDLFVLFLTKQKQNGYFIEFGATNGINISNTLLLEQKYNWKGILSEPARCWHNELKKNRNSIVDTRCVWNKTGDQIEFKETEAADLSTASLFVNNNDEHKDKRTKNVGYNVDTVSLVDLLDQHNAPKQIDYLSIDTEGSEYYILQAFDYNKYDISIITVEHNYVQPNRNNIGTLLNSNGYVKLFEYASKFDDWYVKSSILNNF